MSMHRSLTSMTGYVRPRIEPLTFSDDEGAVIDYGKRWERFDGQPPEDRYEVETHLERFAPLHTVAEALIDHLAKTYDVSVEEGASVCADLRDPPPSHEHVVRAVRLTPTDPLSAPITLVLTDYPSVLVQAGLLADFVHPTCGCDACDEEWESMAEQLEAHVLDVVAGGLREFVSPPRRPRIRFERGMGLVKDMGQTVGYRLASSDGEGWEGSEYPAKDVPKPELTRIRLRLDDVESGTDTGAWRAWARAEERA